MRRAAELGAATVHQELSLVPEMTVAENLFLGEWPRSGLSGVDFPVCAARPPRCWLNWTYGSVPRSRSAPSRWPSSSSSRSPARYAAGLGC
ncbi:hypothetical protein NKH18_01660 [Streptomyces sp. M10(2022)]